MSLFRCLFSQTTGYRPACRDGWRRKYMSPVTFHVYFCFAPSSFPNPPPSPHNWVWENCPGSVCRIFPVLQNSIVCTSGKHGPHPMTRGRWPILSVSLHSFYGQIFSGPTPPLTPPPHNHLYETHFWKFTELIIKHKEIFKVTVATVKGNPEGGWKVLRFLLFSRKQWNREWNWVYGTVRCLTAVCGVSGQVLHKNIGSKDIVLDSMQYVLDLWEHRDIYED